MKRGQLNMIMANKTPLSIAYAKPGNAKPVKSNDKAYEENMRDKTFGDSKPDFIFKDGYRDSPAMTLKDKTSHFSSQVETMDSEASLWDKGPRGAHKVRFSGHEESLDSHSSTSSPKEKEKRNGRLITPPLTSSTESSYSPPSTMKEHLANTYISPKDLLFAPVDGTPRSQNEENIPAASQLSKDYRPLMISSTGNTKPRPPTPYPTATSPPPNGKAVENISNASTQVNETYRKYPQSSDADDEGDDSDLEINATDDDDEEDADLTNPDAKFCSVNKDDEGLHGQLEAVTISPRKRCLDEDKDEDELPLKDRDSNASNYGSEEEEDLKAKNQEEKTAFLRNRQRRNAISEEDKKAIEEVQRVKRVKTRIEDAALVLSTATGGDEGMRNDGSLDRKESSEASDEAHVASTWARSKRHAGMMDDGDFERIEGLKMFKAVEDHKGEL